MGLNRKISMDDSNNQVRIFFDGIEKCSGQGFGRLWHECVPKVDQHMNDTYKITLLDVYHATSKILNSLRNTS